MFKGATVYNQPLPRFEFSSPLFDGDLDELFWNAHAFNQPCLDLWDVSRVVNIRSLLRGAHTFNQPLTSWRMGELISAEHAFSDTRAFNRNTRAALDQASRRLPSPCHLTARDPCSAAHMRSTF